MDKLSGRMAVFTKKYKNVSFKYNSLIEYRVITYAVNLCGKCVPYLQIVKLRLFGSIKYWFKLKQRSI